MTWGDSEDGGDSSQVQEQLQNILQIQATEGAFAAILQCGSVVTWVPPQQGGESRQVQELSLNLGL